MNFMRDCLKKNGYETDKSKLSQSFAYVSGEDFLGYRIFYANEYGRFNLGIEDIKLFVSTNPTYRVQFWGNSEYLKVLWTYKVS